MKLAESMSLAVFLSLQQEQQDQVRTLSSMASKMISFRRIRTSSHPYWKIMYTIMLQKIFLEY